MNERLTHEHLDRALLLFKNFELNGSRDDYQNELLREILENLTEKNITFLADKYDMPPVGSEPWIKNFTRGSDDHSSVRVAAVYTEVQEAHSVETFLQGIQQGKASVGGPGPSLCFERHLRLPLRDRHLRKRGAGSPGFRAPGHCHGRGGTPGRTWCPEKPGSSCLPKKRGVFWILS